MKGRLSLFFISAAFFSCSLVELDKVPRDEENGIWVAPSVDIDGPQINTTLYVTGFDYPEGYDWVSDVERGSVKCSLVVFVEERPLLKVPVGEEYKVSSDPDRHRVIDGHLYTDYEYDSQIFIKKDGKPLFSYPGKETLSDVLVYADSVYTLGQNRSGSGFSCRVNGQTILSRDVGYAFEHLNLDDGKVCFAFAEQVKTVDGVVERYYSAKDGVVTQIAVRDDLTKVWDVVHCGGEVCVLTSLTGIRTPVLLRGDSMTALSLPSDATLLSCRLIESAGYVSAEGLLYFRGSLRSIIWEKEESSCLMDNGKTVAAISLSDDGALHCVVNPSTPSSEGYIYRGSEKLKMPPGYAAMGTKTINSANGILYAGLSSFSGGNPIVWVDGEIREYELNGYISSVSTISEEVETSY